MEQELAHFGIKGMHWGVRRFQKEDGGLTAAGKKRYSDPDSFRKTKLTETVEAKRAHVQAMQKEAGERIKFYGGKNVATNAIQQEAAYKKKMVTAKSVGIGGTIAAGTAFTAALVSESIPVVAIPTAAVVAGTAFIAARKNQKISAIAKEQVAYTKDSDYGPDVVVKTPRE